MGKHVFSGERWVEVELCDFESSDLVTGVRMQVADKVASNKRFWVDHVERWDLTELTFGEWYQANHPLTPYVISLHKSKGNRDIGIAGSGIADRWDIDKKLKYTNDKVVDYCVIFLSDMTSLESYTLAEDRATTYLCKNGEPWGQINCRWERKMGADFITQWEIYLGETYFGTIERKAWLSWNSLKIERINPVSLPIHLDQKRESPIFSLLALPFRIVYLIYQVLRKQDLENKDLVLPEGALDLKDGDELWMYFMVNVVFRMVYHDEMYLGRSR
ncbi:MAG: hypothetical protein GY869_31165 [Planctomycetes bacterium]|nr:hypothetical protein [Planctomycetota bacterium]